MTEIIGDPVWHGSIPRVEETDCALGGDIVNVPNKQFKKIMDMLAYLFNNQQSQNLPPNIDANISDQTVTEMAPNQVIDLDIVFSDPEAGALTYAIESNSEPTKVNASLNSNLLTLSFPQWTDNFNLDSINAVIQVSATDIENQKTTDTFTVTVNNLSTLFTEPYFAFDYVDADAGTSIYVNAAERAAIEGDFNLTQAFTLANAGNPVFYAVAESDGNLIPDAAKGSNVMIEVYRFRFDNTPPFGSYLYTDPAEAVTVRGDANFVEESTPTAPAFWAFNNTLGREIGFKRYRFVGRRTQGDYVYALGSSAPGDSQVFLEGTVCEVKLIP